MIEVELPIIGATGDDGRSHILLYMDRVLAYILVLVTPSFGAGSASVAVSAEDGGLEANLLSAATEGEVLTFLSSAVTKLLGSCGAHAPTFRATSIKAPSCRMIAEHVHARGWDQRPEDCALQPHGLGA